MNTKDLRNYVDSMRASLLGAGITRSANLDKTTTDDIRSRLMAMALGEQFRMPGSSDVCVKTGSESFAILKDQKMPSSHFSNTGAAQLNQATKAGRQGVMGAGSWAGTPGGAGGAGSIAYQTTPQRELHPMERIRARMNWPMHEEPPFDHIDAVRMPNGGYAVFVVVDSKPLVIEDTDMFPSDKLTTQLRMLQK